MTPVFAVSREGTDLDTTCREGWASVAFPDRNGQLPAEEHAWVSASQRGERQAFARLVERYWDSLYRWLYHLTRDRHTAEDLVQETFLKAFRGLKRFEAGSNFKAWLFRIAHNSFANHRRANARARQALPADAVERGDGPAEQVVSREALQLLARAVAKLPDDFRAAFLLRAEEDLSFREIAGVLGLTEETARWRVYKARQKLVSVLAPQLDFSLPALAPRGGGGEPRRDSEQS
ncbi:MAG TPA: sigma-70 family RNA polymerase sigma factor [Gemmataceae bacterium]|nr:sigma-70 family RNA polymerase sigma factor [Gemmataceae bacterium]